MPQGLIFRRRYFPHQSPLAHSFTLAGATFGFVHMPGPPIEAAIALSIEFVASEIIHRWQGEPGLTEQYPWVVAFIFGLLHGFGFAGAIFKIGLPQKSIPIALLFFNIGVEIGQPLFIASVFAFIALATQITRRIKIPRPAWAWAVPPYAIATRSRPNRSAHLDIAVRRADGFQASRQPIWAPC